MRIPELRKILSDRGVHSRAYSIEGERDVGEQYRLERSGGFWSVYYYERGNMIDMRWFAEEEDACDYFLNLLLADRTAQR